MQCFIYIKKSFKDFVKSDDNIIIPHCINFKCENLKYKKEYPKKMYFGYIYKCKRCKKYFTLGYNNIICKNEVIPKKWKNCDKIYCSNLYLPLKDIAELNKNEKYNKIRKKEENKFFLVNL